MLEVNTGDRFVRWDENYILLPISGTPEEIVNFTQFLVDMYNEKTSNEVLD